MNIAVIDADLVGRKKHRFPNLVCMKISNFYKKENNNVVLKTDYNGLELFDKVFIAKVFTDTPIDENILKLPNVEYGGTGFFYDKAVPLPYEIEHTMPDYNLYDTWLEDKDITKTEFKYYLNYSIGFLTRGCFRKCEFCVNKNYNKVEIHSPLSEFVVSDRKYICLLDDNFLGSPKWKELLIELQNTKKRFQFKQGLDERLLTDEKCSLLFSSKYEGKYIFAFDNWKDNKTITEKLTLARKYSKERFRFYCFCGYDRNNKWDEDFWVRDLQELFFRIELLADYGCLPYIMRFNRYEESPYRGMYITIARWCNQPNMFEKKTLREFAILTNSKATNSYIDYFESNFPNATYYLDNIKFKVWG